MLNTKQRIGLLLLFFLISTVLPSKTLPEFYRYFNKEGKAVFVDDKSKIPLKYLEELKTYEEKYDHLTQEQLATLLEKQRRLEKKETSKKTLRKKAKKGQRQNRYRQML